MDETPKDRPKTPWVDIESLKAAWNTVAQIALKVAATLSRSNVGLSNKLYWSDFRLMYDNCLVLEKRFHATTDKSEKDMIANEGHTYASMLRLIAKYPLEKVPNMYKSMLKWVKDFETKRQKILELHTLFFENSPKAQRMARLNAQERERQAVRKAAVGKDREKLEKMKLLWVDEVTEKQLAVLEIVDFLEFWTEQGLVVKIKSQYKALVKRYHPDGKIKNAEQEEILRNVIDAYKELKASYNIK